MVSVSRVPAGGMKRLPVGDGGSSVGAATCTRLSSEIRAWIHVIWPCAPSRIRQIHETPTRRATERRASSIAAGHAVILASRDGRPGPRRHRAQQVTSRGHPRRRMQKTHLRSARARLRIGLCGQQHPAGGCDIAGQGTGHVLRAAISPQIQPLGESAAHLGQIRLLKRPV